MLTSQNKEWGFWGAVVNNTGCNGETAQAIWDDVVFELIHDYGFTAPQAVQFLDSRTGRHIADAMTEGDTITRDLPAWAETSMRHFFKNA